MQDTILNGSGTSRSMKIPASKAVVYQDVSAMVQDMVDGNFLFDIGPIRLEGVTQKGTDLNKANLLKDTTAALYGKGDSASPDDIFAAIAPYLSQIGGKTQIATVYYTGTGTSGSSAPNSVTFPFQPKLVLLSTNNTEGSGYFHTASNLVFVEKLGTSYFKGPSFLVNGGTSTYFHAKLSSDRRTLYWYATTRNYNGEDSGISASAEMQLNGSGRNYSVTALA